MKKTTPFIKYAGSLVLILFLFLVPVAMGQPWLPIDPEDDDSSVAGGWNPEGYNSTGLPDATIAMIVSNIAMWLLGIFGFIGVIGFVISGIFYLTAAGNAEQEKTAKKAMTMSIIGVIVGLLGLVIIKAADLLLAGTNSTF